MKKLIIVLIVIVLIAGLIFAAPAIMNFMNWMGNINGSYSEPETSGSEVSFYAEAGRKLKIVLNSDIKGGELDITVYNSDGENVFTLDNGKELVTYFTPEKDDAYTVRAELTDFMGSFDLTVYKT
ncbi:MAG: PPC domain-containing protein [Ruminiclostridium sp.]